MNTVDELKAEWREPRVRHFAKGFAAGLASLSTAAALGGLAGYRVLPDATYIPLSEVEARGYTKSDVTEALSTSNRELRETHATMAEQLTNALRQLSAAADNEKRLRAQLAAANERVSELEPRPGSQTMALSLAQFTQMTSVRECEHRSMLALEEAGFAEVTRPSSGVINAKDTDVSSTALITVVCSLNAVIVAQRGDADAATIAENLVARINHSRR